MIIESYDVKASSQRSYLSVESTSVTVAQGLRASPQQNAVSGAVQNPDAEDSEKDGATISNSAKELHKKLMEDSVKFLAGKANAPVAARAINGNVTPKTPEELKIRLLEMMIELMTGKKVKLMAETPDEIKGISQNSFMPELGIVANPSRPQGFFGLNVEHFNYESETVTYEAQGVINTADGRTINVDVYMHMSRESVSYFNASIELKRPVDPLVINYGGSSTSLTGETFEFDLTLDGVLDRLSLLGEGSGFLAIDLNGDGIINDGSELFGPSTGNGFAELRSYDMDGNNWIDEADEIFSKLLIWSRDKYGNDQLFTLKELGIGAIYLGDIDTEFSFKDDNNQTQGIMRSTSFFLKENGGAGTIHHVDMTV